MYAEKLTPEETKNIVECTGLYKMVSTRPELNGNHDCKEHEQIVNVINTQTNKPAVITLTDYEISNISDKRESVYESRFAILNRSHNARKINRELIKTYVQKHGGDYVSNARRHRENCRKFNQYNIETSKLILTNLNYSDKKAKDIELITAHNRKIIEKYSKYMELEKSMLSELEEAYSESSR